MAVPGVATTGTALNQASGDTSVPSSRASSRTRIATRPFDSQSTEPDSTVSAAQSQRTREAGVSGMTSVMVARTTRSAPG